MGDEAQWIPIARLGRPHGVRGEVRAWPFDASSQTLFEVSEVLVAPEGAPPGSGRLLEVRRCRPSGRALSLKLSELSDRDHAAALNGHIVSVRQGVLPQLDEDEFYHHELIGAQVQTTHGERLGVLEEILDTGAHGVLVVRDREAGVEVTLPFVEGMVEVQVEARRLVVDPPEGLIEATREPIGGRS